MNTLKSNFLLIALAISCAASAKTSILLDGVVSGLTCSISEYTETSNPVHTIHTTNTDPFVYSQKLVEDLPYGE